MSGSTDAPEDMGVGATQMHDAAIEAGLVERPERVVTDDEFNLAYREELEKQVARMQADRTVAELVEAEEDGDDDDALIAQLRAKRIEELKASRAAKLQAQELPEVDPFDFEQQVQAPSKHGFVVLLVYRAHHGDSALLQGLMRTVSAAHPSLVCKQMHVSQHIANLPPQDCPVLLIYRHGRVVKQLVGLSALAGKDTTPAVIEWELADMHAIDTPLEEDPRVRIKNARKLALRKQQDDESSQDEDSDIDY